MFLGIYIIQKDRSEVTVVQTSWKQVEPFRKVSIRFTLKNAVINPAFKIFPPKNIHLTVDEWHPDTPFPSLLANSICLENCLKPNHSTSSTSFLRPCWYLPIYMFCLHFECINTCSQEFLFILCLTKWVLI